MSVMFLYSLLGKFHVSYTNRFKKLLMFISDLSDSAHHQVLCTKT